MPDLFQAEAPTGRGKVLALSAVVLVAVAAAVFFTWFHHEDHAFAEASITNVQIVPIHTVYKHEIGEEATDRTEDVTYLIAHVAVLNRFRAPLFVKDITADITDADGVDRHSAAAEPRDIAVVIASFPQLKSALDAAGAPLRRETNIAPNTSADGYVLLQFPIGEKAWQGRQASTLKIDFYHNSSIATAFPK